MKTPHLAVGLLLGLAFAGAASAAEVRGVIARVDLDKKELVLEGRGVGLRGAEFVFDLDGDTQVQLGPNAGTLADLAPGMRVRVQFDDRPGRAVARMIRPGGLLALVPKTPAAPPPVPAVPAVPGDADALTGVLQHVGYSDREVVVIGPGAKGAETETTIAVPEKVKIMKGDKSVALDDLKEGEQVSVQVEKGATKPTAASIRVGPGGPAPATADAPKTLPRVRKLLQLLDQFRQEMDKDR